MNVVELDGPVPPDGDDVRLCLCGHYSHFHHFSRPGHRDPAPGCYGAGEERGVRSCRCQGFVEAWASGYLIEFTDQGPPERHVIRVCGEQTAERTSAALSRLGALPYNGLRPVLYGTVFYCTQASLGDEGVVSELWSDGPGAAISRLNRKIEEEADG